ncbi:MAG: HU family DNA-binding protein [Bacteroidaceae bacterium]|nr:HU family DNA-binding protein [Bacteroidaceae bacterium]MBR6927005.1 HU family DNA-binding protein [Bacteroidaceae bacterium]MBR7028508.1 HU family DNA-binding protein [Bacteroidaceae bacterium]
MTKADIVNQINRNTGIDKVTVSACVEAFIDAVSNSLVEKEPVYLRGFGSFILKTRKQKLGRNITKNTSIVIPEHQIAAFKPSKKLAVRLN